MASSSSTMAFDGIAPSASPSASKRIKKPSYDVFINHRGPDVKSTLASVLYGILTGMALSVFLDSEELEYGDFLPQTIESVMTTALLHIAIFSPRYAESPWCLAELSFMLKTGATIIPIFYHVEPNDLRYIDQGKGIYVDAFREHERKGRYSLEQLQEWKKSLKDVSFYNGQIIKTPEDETRLLKNIGNCVLKEINNDVPLVVAKHPVGLKEIVQDFEMNTLQSAWGVQIVGIWGMGGSGKTTLAKELYNKRSSSMQRSSIIFDVRDGAAKGLLHDKQRQLLNDLGVMNAKIDNTEQGKALLTRHVGSVSVLIVLDDVDHKDQLDALLPAKNNLRGDSLIIVTTRECEVLTSWGISSIYKMRALDPFHAEQLFCWHAFLQSFPLDGFEELVKKFLDACQRLPLSLKVFGGQLYGKSCEYWESLLKILLDDIKNKLKVSYDALDYEEKEAFLDTACFFIGEDKSLAIKVWNSSGWSGQHIWKRLLNKCLVELDNDNFIRMHNCLKDLGREIANQHSPSRLWLPEHHKQIEKRNDTRGIKSLQKWRPYGELMTEISGGSLVGLKLLVISGDLDQVICEVSRELLWLRWSEFKDRNLPALSLKNLRVLQLYKGWNLEELWKADSNIQSLEHLELSCCPMLSSLPHRFGDLKALRHLDLGNCGQLKELPRSFEQLIHLEYLRLSCCGKLKLRSDVLKNITTLQYLDLTRCHELEELPHQITNQESLTRLFVEGTSLRYVPTNIDELGNLEELRIGSPMLTSLPSSLGNLSRLNSLLIDGCSQLEYLPPSVCLLDLLRQVKIRASGLRELPFGSAGSSNFEVKGKQASISACNLRPSITEHGSPQTYFPNKLPASLETLSLVANPQLMEIRILPQSLKILEICACKMLKNMSGIGGLVKLSRLEIYSCPELDELPSFADLVSLEEFKIQGCPKVDIIQGLEHCKSLRILTAELPSIKSLENAIRLRRVDLTCDTISALKPCILSMKECPWEMMIRGRVITFVEPIVDSSSFKDLRVLLLEKDSDWDNITQDLFKAAFLWYEEEKESNNEESGSSGVKTSVGKVVHIAVCGKGSSAFPEYCVGRRFGRNPNFKQRKAVLATGYHHIVVAAFHKLIALLK